MVLTFYILCLPIHNPSKSYKVLKHKKTRLCSTSLQVKLFIKTVWNYNHVIIIFCRHPKQFLKIISVYFFFVYTCNDILLTKSQFPLFITQIVMLISSPLYDERSTCWMRISETNKTCNVTIAFIEKSFEFYYFFHPI